MFGRKSSYLIARPYSSDPFNPWVRVYEVKCGEGGNWLAPNETDWPLCQYKDEYSCDPALGALYFSFSSMRDENGQKVLRFLWKQELNNGS